MVMVSSYVPENLTNVVLQGAITSSDCTEVCATPFGCGSVVVTFSDLTTLLFLIGSALLDFLSLVLVFTLLSVLQQ